MFCVNIRLNTVEKARNFVTLMQQFDPSITLVEQNYNNTNTDRSINAKSILGIFTLNLTKPLKVLIDTSNVNEFKDIYKTLQNFIVAA